MMKEGQGEAEGETFKKRKASPQGNLRGRQMASIDPDNIDTKLK